MIVRTLMYFGAFNILQAQYTQYTKQKDTIKYRLSYTRNKTSYTHYLQLVILDVPWVPEVLSRHAFVRCWKRPKADQPAGGRQQAAKPRVNHWPRVP